MKYALIAGGSRGIGAATAVEFARRGWGVAVNYHRSQREAHSLVEQLRGMGVPALAVQADVSDRGAVMDMVEYVLGQFPQLDILVCNAGVADVDLVTHMDEARWRRLFGVNVDGMHYCVQGVLPYMIGRKQGCIVTMSSMWGQVGGSCEVAYSATKGAVIGYTKALAKEVGPSGIRVNCVAPGVIDTEMNGALTGEDLAALAEETPLGRIGQPEEVARTIAFLASEASSFLTGQVLAPNGGLVI
ncbi:MAG TPA: 3-oxoacyl-ACP reductase [Clostridiales bacterium]|nr:3-oxoacyl-ACP reductase [Clostridiales bacterium]